MNKLLAEKKPGLELYTKISTQYEENLKFILHLEATNQKRWKRRSAEKLFGLRLPLITARSIAWTKAGLISERRGEERIGFRASRNPSSFPQNFPNHELIQSFKESA